MEESFPKTYTRILTKREKSLLHKGHSVNNALLPKYGSNQLWFDYDNKGSLFGFYGYSFSDAFQIEIANLGRFKNNVLNTFFRQ